MSILDPLTMDRASRYPGAYRGAMTVEFGAPSFGCHVVSDVYIFSTHKRLTGEIPYLSPAGREGRRRPVGLTAA